MKMLRETNGILSSSYSNSTTTLSNQSSKSDLSNKNNDSGCHSNLIADDDDLRVVKEMAIDCPDSFIPEIKTRPSFPPPRKSSINSTNTDESEIKSKILAITSITPAIINENSNKSEFLTSEDELCNSETDYLIKKIQEYGCDNLKLVKIEKQDSPLGATISNRNDSIIISRIVYGGVVEKSGLLNVNDEILEINCVPVNGKTINSISDMLCNLKGMINFLIIPNNEFDKIDQQKSSSLTDNDQVIHLKALFNYAPEQDLFIPCKELGLSFSKGDILHVISRDDDNWWQAYKEQNKESLAGLIPAQSFQENRIKQIKEILKSSNSQTSKKMKRKHRLSFLRDKRKSDIYLAKEDFDDEKYEEDIIMTYERVELYKPRSNNQKRPIILIGPHGIGKNELRNRLIDSNPTLFESAILYTSRDPLPNEINGQDFYFITKSEFKQLIGRNDFFLEYGKYQKNLYGTSYETVRQCVRDKSKICIMNLYAETLKKLDKMMLSLLPYIIYIAPPNLPKLKELKKELGHHSYNDDDLLKIIEQGRQLEEDYGQHFDKIIRNVNLNETFKQLLNAIESAQSQDNWVPISWLNTLDN